MEDVAMTLTDEYELADRYRRDDGQVLLTGIQALTRIPIEQLRADRAASCEPITAVAPSSSLTAGWWTIGRSGTIRSARCISRSNPPSGDPGYPDTNDAV